MVQQVKLALVREREPAMLERKRWNEIARRKRGRKRGVRTLHFRVRP